MKYLLLLIQLLRMMIMMFSIETHQTRNNEKVNGAKMFMRPLFLSRIWCLLPKPDSCNCSIFICCNITRMLKPREMWVVRFKYTDILYLINCAPQPWSRNVIR